MVLTGETDPGRFLRDRGLLLAFVGGQELVVEDPLTGVGVIGHKAFLFARQLIVGDLALQLSVSRGVVRHHFYLHEIARRIQDVAGLVLALILVNPVVEGSDILKVQRHELDQALVVALRLVEGRRRVVLPAIVVCSIIFIELLHHERELLFAGFVVQQLGAVQGNVCGNQVAALVGPHMGLGMRTGVYLVADHGAVELAGLF